ncbi:MAG: DUF4034 domain-containing protein [Bacteroidota bacterium]
MLGKLFNLFKKEPASKIDFSLGYPRLAEFKKYLANGDFKTFESRYEELSWDAKTLLNEGIGLNNAFSGEIEKWVDKNPESYIAHLFSGVSKTCQAWIARTSARGSAVSDERAQMFLSLLEEAYEHLNTADKINPEDAEICARMIRVGMGLGMETEVVLGYFEAAAELVPNHLMAHLMMINFLNPKWHGSLEEMQDFAEERYEEADSSLLIALRLFAITEEWNYLDMQGETEKRKAFFKDEKRKGELLDLYKNYREEEGGKLMIPYVYNYFSFLLYMTGEKNLAREIVKKITAQLTTYPWAYLGIDSNEKLQAI